MKQVYNNKITKQVITEIETRDKFLAILKSMNPGLFIIKLGASWCGPCHQIKDVVHAFFASSPAEVVCADIDVDVCFDFYSFLKSKKMVNGIPAILCYHKGNENYIPNDMVTGADPVELHKFFKRCGAQLSRQISMKEQETNKEINKKTNNN